MNEQADREARDAATEKRVREEEGKVPRSGKGTRIHRSTQEMLLAQLRSRYCRWLAAYHKVVDDSADATCPQSGREPEKLEHWLHKCTTSAARRIAEVGVVSPPL